MSKNFEELLKALADTDAEADATLAKAQAAADPEMDDDPDGDEDDTIQAAAAEGGEGAPAAEAAPGAAAPEFGKSFEFTDAAGQKHEAVDATDLVKSLLERQEATEGTLAKALTTLTGLAQKQGEMIKSLTAQVSQLASQGRGRKTVLSVAEKPDAGVLAKSEGASDGMTAEQFFAKANAAFDAEKISGKDLNVISVCLRSNHPIDPTLIQKVVSA